MSSSSTTLCAAIGDDSVLSPLRFDGSRSPHCSLHDSIIVYLSLPGSSVRPLRVLESESIASVKLRIQSSEGFDVRSQRLLFDGKELSRNNSLLRDYGVADGNFLHLAVRLSDVRLITVHTACGKKLELQVERRRSIRYVKEQIAEKSKDLGDIAVSDQKLICDGEELDDRLVVDEICKSSDGVLYLFARNSAEMHTTTVGNDFEVFIYLPTPASKDEIKLTANGEEGENLPSVELILVNSKANLSLGMMDMVSAASAGLGMGKLPIMSSEGTGGAYFMQDGWGKKHAGIFKPIDEEPMAVNNPRGLPVSIDGEGMKRGTRVGEGALREVAAYILDHPISGRRDALSEEIGFSGVPPTVMVRCINKGFNNNDDCGKEYKFGSFQMFVQNIGSCEDMGPGAFPVKEVHKIAVLDIRLANTDRHAGNILISKRGKEDEIVLVPIDHGYCLPENFEDCTFEWLYWPQAKEPFTSSEVVDYIRSLDAEEDISLLKFYGWDIPVECARILRISTMLLKKSVEIGLTPFDIGSLMCRKTLKKMSVIEEITHEAENSVLPGTSEAAFMEEVSAIMDRWLADLFL